jgi:hypothetical protein
LVIPADWYSKELGPPDTILTVIVCGPDEVGVGVGLLGELGLLCEQLQNPKVRKAKAAVKNKDFFMKTLHKIILKYS